MSSLPPCPQCKSEFTYEDGANYVCPECAHEWPQVAAAEEQKVVRDANGNVLQDGDTITVIKDLKVKGTSVTLKRGTVIKGIRLIDKTPRKGAEGMTIAFLHPKSTQGILTELCENKNK